MNIEDVVIGQTVKLPENEEGRVSKIDYETDMVFVDVVVAAGVDTVAMDPSEITPSPTQ